MQTSIVGLFQLTIFFVPAMSLLFFNPFSLQAEEIDVIDRSKAKEVMAGQKDDVPYLTDEVAGYLDDKQDSVSGHLISAATWFDSFFVDERYAIEENRTTARLILSTGIDRHEDVEFKPRVRLRVHLPRASDRLNLLISANDDEDFDVERDPGNLNSRDDDTDLTAALQYFLLQTEKMNISATAGLSFNYAYGGVRYREAYEYGSWQGRFVSRLRYYSDDGWNFRNQYDIERQVSDTLLFRTTLDANWQGEENGIPHAVTFSLFQALRLDRALHYDISNNFNTRPSYQMTDMIFRLRYRLRFYRDWLVFEVAPQVSFPREYDREINPGIIFRLEAEFGYKSYKDQYNRIFSF